MATRTTKRMFIMLGAVLVLIIVLAGLYALHIMKLIASIPKPQPQVVSSAVARLQDWQPQLKAVGSLVAVRGVDLSSEVAGLVRQVNFKSGQDVRAGTVLVQLNADAEIAAAQSLQAAVELAKVVLARDQQQLAVKAVSQAQVDADLADLHGKQANLAQQQALVAKKSIRAPFDGRVGITTVNPGQYLNPGDKIVTLQKLDPVYVDFYLPQQQIDAVRVGQSVQLSGDGFAGTSYVGKVSAINPKVDTGTRNVQIEAVVPNPKKAVLPGMFARVDLATGAPQRLLTLPQTAITYNPYGSTVFVIPPGEHPKVNQVFVNTGATRGDQVAVTSGVKEGDQVVTSGQVKLKNGTEVVVDNKVLPADSPNPTPQEK
jgi:membrane fusion protein (multidrug efflux system)